MRLAKFSRTLLLLALPAVLRTCALAQEHPNVQPSAVRDQLMKQAPGGIATAACAPKLPHPSLPRRQQRPRRRRRAPTQAPAKGKSSSPRRRLRQPRQRRPRRPKAPAKAASQKACEAAGRKTGRGKGFRDRTAIRLRRFSTRPGQAMRRLKIFRPAKPDWWWAHCGLTALFAVQAE